ncbi:MAG TPA: hypothetical protein VNH64_06600 [Parvularculaceae bacterium]|nr:hypothetical protein [Parvularculaceae bacterium]
MMRKSAMAAIAALALAACVSATPYQPASQGRGYGFSEQQIEQNRYRITFRGNSSTTREMVENALLYRAAELTVQNGYDYFLVEERNTEANKSYSTEAYPAFYGHYGFGHPGFCCAFPYYAFGWGWAPYDSYTREYTRYSAVAYVVMMKGQKPTENPQAFDAREVMKNLGPLVIGGEQRPAQQY